MKPTKDQFKLKKITVKQNETSISWQIREAHGQEVHHNKHNVDFDWIPHKDLTDVLENYKPILAAVYYYDKINQKQHSEDVESKIKIKGLTLSGEDKTRGVTIIGSIMSERKRPLNLVSDNLHYVSSGNYADEQGFKDIEKALIDEVYQFIYDQKRGELDAFKNGELTPEEQQA